MHGLGSSVEETNQWKMRNHGSYLARIKSYHLQGLKHTSDVRQQLRVLSVRGCQIQTSQGEATALNEWPQKDTGQVEERPRQFKFWLLRGLQACVPQTNLSD